jgi:hypothetical protein
MAAKAMAAAALFVARGLDGATMSDIVETTGIPRATPVWNCFAGKSTELPAGGDDTKKGPDPADLAGSGPFSSDRQLS